MKAYIKPGQPGLFDKAARLDELHDLGDPLARLDSLIDWARFEPVLARIPKPDAAGLGGRPAFHPLMMFKAMVIKHLYNLSDAQLQFQITDRMSFKKFLGLTDADRAPDEKTFWKFGETLAANGLFDELFAQFHHSLKEHGMIANKGQIIDATFVDVPRQRNRREENAQIKAGEVPQEWAENPAKARQKDVDARWASKSHQRHYGYKNHVKVDSRSKLIDAYFVSSASTHDSQALEELVQVGDPVTYADSAYAGDPCQAVFDERGVEFKPIERAYRNKPLSKRQEQSNHARSKVRVRVEHVFGTMKMTMRAAWNRCIGITRNRAAIAMTNRVYNMVRFEQIVRLGLKTWRTA
jgi:IS5 family transposase